MPALLGSDQPALGTGVAGAVGTSGAAAIELDSAIRGKLVEFRTHLKEFERAAAGPSEVMPSSATASTAADQPKASEQVDRAEANKHLEAISEILNTSTTGTLTRAQTAELKKHVAELRQALQHGKED